MSIDATNAVQPATPKWEVQTSTMVMTALGGRAALIEDKLRDKANEVQQSNDKQKALNEFTSLVRFGENNAELGVNSFDTFGDVDTPDFTMQDLENGDKFVNFGDGTGVLVEHGADAENSWKIVEFDPSKVPADGKAPEFTSESRIFGDPHVDENSDGKIDFDFLEQSTFLLPNGVKITVSTSPSSKGEGTVSDSLFISRGDQQALVTGLNNNEGRKGAADDTYTVVNDGSLFKDEDINDGHVFATAKGSVGDWSKLDGEELGRVKVQKDLSGFGFITASRSGSLFTSEPGLVGEEKITNEITTLPNSQANQQLFEKLGLNSEDFLKGGVIVLTAEDQALVDEGFSHVFTHVPTPAELTLYEELGVNLDGNQFGETLVFTLDELENILESAKGLGSGLTAISSSLVLDLQAIVNAGNENLKLQTNTMSTEHNQVDSVIQNTRL